MQVPIRVECYSGHTYAQEPRAFEWEGRRYQVERVVKRWRTPAGPGFRVEVAGISNLQPLTAKFVDLTYIESTNQWTMSVQT